jgi:protein gp37
MKESKIDWPFHPFATWNIVVGCKHRCFYCWARRMNQRFKYIPNWESPEFFLERLDKPIRTKKPTTFFVVAMGDLFGEWISEDWIKQVIRVCEICPQHTFLFLTKNPYRYLQFTFPSNVMLGTTFTHWSIHAGQILNIMRTVKLRNIRTFASVEPLFGPFKWVDFSSFDLVIVGAQTGPKPVIPLRTWVDSIKYYQHIWYKKNIIKIFPDLKNK